MRLSLRFIIPLFLALGALAYAVVPLVDKLALQWFERDLDLRATLIASTVQEPLRDLIRAGNRTRLLQFFTRISQDERLYAVGFCPMGLGEPTAAPAVPEGDPRPPPGAVLEPLGTAAPESRRPAARLGPVPRG